MPDTVEFSVEQTAGQFVDASCHNLVGSITEASECGGVQFFKAHSVRQTDRR